MEDVFTVKDVMTQSVNATKKCLAEQEEIQNTFDKDSEMPSFPTKTIKEVIHSNEPETEWLVEDYIQKGNINGITGDPEGGKTIFVERASLSVASGRDFGGKKVEQGNVLYIDEEDVVAETKRRFRLMAKGEGFSDEDLENIHYSSMIGFKFEPKWIVPLKKVIIEKNIKLVVFDSLFCCTVGNLKDVTDSRTPFDLSKYLMQKTGVTILIIHHQPKSSSIVGLKRAYGSIVISASFRSQLELVHNEKTDVFTLTQVKRSSGKRKKEKLKYKILGDEAEGDDFIKFDFFEKSNEPEFDKKLKQEELQEKILNKLKEESLTEFTTNWVHENFEDFKRSTQDKALRQWYEDSDGKVGGDGEGNWKVRDELISTMANLFRK